MTPEKIIEKRKALEERAKLYAQKIKLIRVKQRYLQELCQHPNMKSYWDKMGGGVYCEICGYET